MNKKKKLHKLFVLLVIIGLSMLCTSCEAKFGGEITIGYIIGCVFCAIFGLSAPLSIYGFLDGEPWGECRNVWACLVSFVLALILSILPFLWHPIPLFNLILFIVNFVQAFALAALAGVFDNFGTKPQPVSGATPATVYNVAVNGDSTGPFTVAQLTQMAQSGQINAQSMVWTAGMANWAAAGTVAELAGLFAPPVPPVPPCC